MNGNNVYAYLLLGAVVLAGIGGFMMADFDIDAESPDVPIISAAGSFSVTVIDGSELTGGTDDGETQTQEQE
jgi:hypothetical protein